MTTDSNAVKSIGLSSISNPMDWKAIDRFILLACLVLLAPLAFGVSMWATNILAPEWLNQTLVTILSALYLMHIAVMGSFILTAMKLRRYTHDWPLFENAIISSFLVTVMTTGYLTGTHLSEALLIIFLGVIITCTLADVNKIKFCFWIVVPILVVMAALDYTEAVPYAMLLERSPYAEDGRPLDGWMMVRMAVAVILAPLIYLCILAMKRWTERESLYLEMSTIDGLTRLSNRNSLISRGQEEIRRARASDAMPSLSCIMIDLDHFKQINDTWGHHAGDEVLVAASKVMMDSARPNDEVGRYGGEEFAVLLPGTTLLQAKLIAERIRKRISSMNVVVDGQKIDVTASFGVACYPSPDVEAMSDLLKTADKALYEAKESGRNQVVAAQSSSESTRS